MSIAFVLKGYPRLSETFIAQEILGLQRRGLAIEIYSLRHPTDDRRHPVHDEITCPVRYLPEYLHYEPARVIKAWRRARKLPGYAKAYAIWRADFQRDRTRNRLRRFGQACVLAAELPESTQRLHFHFLHTPGSAARYAALMRGLPLSGSAHAKDIWTIPDWEKREKLADLDFLATCTASGAEHLQSLADDPDKVLLAYHGLDLSRFSSPAKPDQTRDGRDVADPVRLLSVGRAVPKKGYDDLLAALARLPDDLAWHLTHIGGGDGLAALKQASADHGLADRIDWRGAQAQSVVLEALRGADLFVLPSKIAADGDRDGLPNVLMEAASQALPALATTISGIPEFITTEQNGVLVEPGAPQSLADALVRLIGDPDLRTRLGGEAERVVRTQFNADTCLDDLEFRLKD